MTDSGTMYSPQPGVHPGRPPCAHCHAAYRLHGVAGSTTDQRSTAAAAGTLPCPTAWRPSSLAAALAAVRTASAAADQPALFVARGDVQRLLDHRRGSCAPALCEACDVLYATATEAVAP